MKTQICKSRSYLFRTSVAAALIAIVSFLPALSADPIPRPAASNPKFKFDVSKNLQPDFEHPRKYSPSEMRALAQEVLGKMYRKLGAGFDRTKPDHVWELAQFFFLTPDPELDLYSTPMEEPDAAYFADVKNQKNSELYPQDAKQLVVRFYWEGIARVAGAYYKLDIVNERHAAHPEKSRGKVSDIATFGMFEKKPGITMAQVIAQGKERYDLRQLINHLKVKGLPHRN